MKRDMDLIREILLRLEADGERDLSKWDTAAITYHTALIVEADLAHGQVVESNVGEPAMAYATRLTWDGHEFLDAAKDQGLWNKARTAVSDQLSSVSITVLTSLLNKMAKEALGLP